MVEVAARSASRVKRTLNWRSTDSSADRIFSASLRGSVGWRARYTVPIPPEPSTFSMRYPAMTVPTASGMSGLLSGQHAVLGGHHLMQCVFLFVLHLIGVAAARATHQ